MTIQDRIRQIIARIGKLPVAVDEITNDRDLYEAGLTSLVTVNLMLALEDAFDVEFPDELLSRRTFQTVDSMALAVGGLVG